MVISSSVNPVNIIQPSITSRFTGDEAKGRETTIGRFYSVEYALIKTFGAINPANLDKCYSDTSSIKEKFIKYSNELPIILWDGTNQLVTRSKYPQKSILFIQVDYKDVLYNDLAVLVSESDALKKDNVMGLVDDPFDFTSFVKTLNNRKDVIEKIRIKYTDEIKDDVKTMLSKLEGITIDQI